MAYVHAPPNLAAALRLDGDTSSLTICRTCMLTVRGPVVSRGGGGPVLPSHPPQPDPSPAAAPQVSSSHPTQPLSSSGFQHLQRKRKSPCFQCGETAPPVAFSFLFFLHSSSTIQQTLAAGASRRLREAPHLVQACEKSTAGSC